MKSGFYIALALLAFNTHSLQAQTISTLAGTGAVGFAGNGGPAALAQFNHCVGVAFDGAGNVYIADRDNNMVRKINTLGIITTLAGNGTAGYTGDGGAATAAKLYQPANIAVDVAGNVYISDNGNNAIRKVTVTGTISTYAGNGTAGYNGDAGTATAAQLNSPQGLALDDTGALYIADAANHALRMVDTTHMITTIAGTGTSGSTGDGGAALSAELNMPVSVAIDVNQNIYISDFAASVVRKIDAATGMISTVAGSGSAGYSGDGAAATAARLLYPSGISVDGAGNLFIADQGNSRVRKVNTAGTISTFAGSSTTGYLGDNGPANAAEISQPKDVAADGWGHVYIADYGNNVVRVVSATTGIAAVKESANGITAYPNPSDGIFTVTIRDYTGFVTTIITDVTGKVVTPKAITNATGSKLIDLSNMPAGTYFLSITAGDKTYSEMISLTK